MKALIIIDVQNDFLPGGSLEVPEGDQIIPLINDLLQTDFDNVIATKDWHPSNHGSFAANHSKNPGEIIQLDGLKQILWPVHCVQNTFGAQFASNLNTDAIDKIIFKGLDKNIDSYSAFSDNGHRKSTELEKYLRDLQITELYFAGLATDYCVKFSVLDALQIGFKCFVIKDACRGVNLNSSDSDDAFQNMSKVGATIIHSSEL